MGTDTSAPRSQIDAGPGARDGWSGLFRLAAVFCFLVAGLIAAAVGLYFVWPYSPGRLGTEEILMLLADSPFAGFMSLDLSMVVIAPFNAVVFVALYGALREQNRGFALVALVVGSVAFAIMIVSRPVLELRELGLRYAAATTAPERAMYVTVAETLLIYYEGTAWFIQTVLYLLPGLIFGILMRHAPGFGRAVATVGIVVAAAGYGFVIPTAGPLFLMLNTIGSVVWYGMVGRCLAGLGRG